MDRPAAWAPADRRQACPTGTNRSTRRRFLTTGSKLVLAATAAVGGLVKFQPSALAVTCDAVAPFTVSDCCFSCIGQCSSLVSCCPYGCSGELCCIQCNILCA